MSWFLEAFFDGIPKALEEAARKNRYLCMTVGALKG
jgi:hypothetical protein